MILRGQVYGNMDALDYHAYKVEAMQSVMAAWRALSQRYDVIIAEGAGSRRKSICALTISPIWALPKPPTALCCWSATVIAAGVFAQLVGTLDLLSASEQARTKGFIINRFR